MRQLHGSHDSPRWCEFCEVWGDHHTDRCPAAKRVGEALADPNASWRGGGVMGRRIDTQGHTQKPEDG